MNKPKEIRSFREEYSFLSNFYPCKIVYDGFTFTSVETTFQAAKCAERTDRLQFQYLEPVKAKRIGRQIKLRNDWEQVKLSILTEFIRLKFTGNPELLSKLLATGDALLVEKNTWHDNFYGDCKCDRCRNKPGKNHLGQILMKIRDEMLNSSSELRRI